MENKNKNTVVIGVIDTGGFETANARRIVDAGGVLLQPCYQGISKTLSGYVLNPMPDGTSRTIKNQYYKNGISNFLSTGTFGATGVIKCVKNQEY